MFVKKDKKTKLKPFLSLLPLFLTTSFTTSLIGYSSNTLAANKVSNLEQAYTNSIGMKFKKINAGSFFMGSCKTIGKTDKEKAADKKRQFMGLPATPAKKITCPAGTGVDSDAGNHETPQHKVRIPYSFQVGIYEVTLGQYKKFITATNKVNLLTDNFMKYNSHGDSAAVSYVSWNDTQHFIAWLNKKENSTKGGATYRLLSEAEWEYAARAGTKTRYSWGNSKNKAGNYAWFDGNAFDRGQKYAHKVGSKGANPWGLYDMHGNVWEWTQDCWNNNYSGAPTQGEAWLRGDCSLRMLRGGSWINSSRNLRAATRYFNRLGYGSNGFRLARTY